MERGDIQAAIIACEIVNVNRDPKKQRKPFKPEQFMPKWQKQRSIEDYDEPDEFGMFPSLADTPPDEMT